VTEDLLRPRATIAILADDLIWAARLEEGVRRAGGRPIRVRSQASLAAVLQEADGCLVDLTARAYDGPSALRVAHQAGVPAIAVGQHDDAALRRAALDAGAARVHAYRALFEKGDALLAVWIEGLVTARAGTAAPEDRV
jgi:hypothetical protein